LDAPVETSTAAWDSAVDSARAAFSDVRLPTEAFAAHAASCRAKGARAEHLADLFLAWAAARGDAGALRRFQTRLRPEVEAAARRVDSSPPFADELLQRMRVRLLVEESSGKRLDAYVGRGALGGWLRVAALRLALNMKRDAAPAASDEDILRELVAAEPDAELRHLKMQYRSDFRTALEAALAALPSRERLLLRLHYVDGMRLLQIARLYGVHESTASRWLTQAVEAVGADARRRLVERLSISAASADSIARMVQSGLDLSIARLLGSQASR
jgi:RNA polymerase sigma-70 factor (ECF subfamily)